MPSQLLLDVIISNEVCGKEKSLENLTLNIIHFKLACYCYLFLLSVFILWFSYYVSDIFCKF